jgi:hypothetical protein
MWEILTEQMPFYFIDKPWGMRGEIECENIALTQI